MATSDLGGVAQWGPDDGRVLMDARRMMTLSSAMVALTAIGPDKAYALNLGWRNMMAR